MSEIFFALAVLAGTTVQSCLPALQAGDTIRLSVPSLEWRHEVVRLERCSRDDLTVTRHDRRITLRSDNIARLEVRVRRRDHRWWGLLLGAAAGATIGARVHLEPDCEVFSPPPYDCSPYCGERGCPGRASTVAGAVTAVGLGGFIAGLFVTSDVWQDVSLVRPVDGLAVRFRF